MHTDLVALIAKAAQEVYRQNDDTLPAPLHSDTPLFGRDGILDSMGLVSLIVAVEQWIEDDFGMTVSLADDRAFSESASPYRTIGSLADYASRLIHGAA